MYQEPRAYGPNQQFCHRCGARLEPGAGFCGNCGALASGGTEQPLDLPGPPLYPREFMGFWIRLLAWVIDIVLISVIQLLLARFGLNILALFVGPVYTVLLIGLRGQTLGKMALGIVVINELGEVPGLWKAVLREIVGKLISGIALGLGYAWIGWDQEKRGWHDHIASTWVVRKQRPRAL